MSVKPSLNILIYNVHSTLNAGDRALLECTVRQIRDNFSNPHLIILSNWPEEPVLQEIDAEIVPSPWICSGVTQQWSIWKQIAAAGWGWLAAQLEARFGLRLAAGNWRKLFDAYKKADLVICVAGNQYFSTGRFGWPFPVTALSSALGHIYGKPGYTMPQSIGPLKRGWERRMLRDVYSLKRMIQLRDAISEHLASEIRLPMEKIVSLPDIAFDFPPAPSEEALAILQRYGYTPGSHAVGATIIGDPGRSQPPGSMKEYYRVMAEILRRLVKQYQLSVYLFIQVAGPTSQENDRLGINQVMAHLGEDSRHLCVVDELLTPAQLKACYGYMDLFLPTRMHSGIFAMSMGVPCIFVGYLTKTRGVLQALGLDEWMVQVGSVDTEEMWKKVETAWLERKERAAHLQNIIPPIVEECRKAGLLIAKDFAKYGG